MKAILITTILLLVTGCASKHEDIKSPCVGIEKSPCVRMPINEGVA